MRHAMLIAALLLGACAPDIAVKATAGSLVGKTDKELVQRLGEPVARLKDSKNADATIFAYSYSSSAEVPGYWRVQCFGGVCLQTMQPPTQSTNTCTVGYTVVDGIVRSFATEGGCK